MTDQAKVDRIVDVYERYARRSSGLPHHVVDGRPSPCQFPERPVHEYMWAADDRCHACRIALMTGLRTGVEFPDGLHMGYEEVTVDEALAVYSRLADALAGDAVDPLQRLDPAFDG